VRRGGRYDLVTLDMGFTLVNLNSGVDRMLLALGRRLRPGLTLDEVRSAQRQFWDAWNAADADRVWEPNLAADMAESRAIDAGILHLLGIDDPAIVDEATAESRRRYTDVATYTIFPDAIPALEALRASVPVLGIVSNWGWHLPGLCVSLGLDRYVDFIVSSARVGAAKPNARIFRHALEMGGCAPSRALHVGDSLMADVRGAEAAGMTGVLLDRSGTSNGVGCPVLRELTELPQLIR
jgi:HAD superfamily hydrolase (TIGR01509 family)